MTATIQFPAL